jgi:hypothetical protein
MGVIDKLHDKFFKGNMSNIDTAKDFMLNYLPEDILKIIDFDNLLPFYYSISILSRER